MEGSYQQFLAFAREFYHQDTKKLAQDIQHAAHGDVHLVKIQVPNTDERARAMQFLSEERGWLHRDDDEDTQPGLESTGDDAFQDFASANAAGDVVGGVRKRLRQTITSKTVAADVGADRDLEDLNSPAVLPAAKTGGAMAVTESAAELEQTRRVMPGGRSVYTEVSNRRMSERKTVICI
jgi:hypothetical protein